MQKSRIAEELALHGERLHRNGTKEYLGRTFQQFEDPVAFGAKGNRSSHAIISMQDPCEELAALCRANNWVLLKYIASPSESNDGYLADVTVKVNDSDVSQRSDLKRHPIEAVNSAANKMIVLLKGIPLVVWS